MEIFLDFSFGYDPNLVIKSIFSSEPGEERVKNAIDIDHLKDLKKI